MGRQFLRNPIWWTTGSFKHFPFGFVSRTFCLLFLLVSIEGCSGSGSDPDTPPPAPGNGGLVTVGDVTDRSVSIAWTRAKDDRIPPQFLEYCVSYGSSAAASVKTSQCALDVDSMTIVGLDKASSYDFEVTVKDRAGNTASYHRATATTLRILPLSFFVNSISNDFGLMPSVADLDGDGWLETLGTKNDGRGNLVAISPADIGLQTLLSPGRVHRDARLVDLNGDGKLDVVANTYSDIDNLDSFARLYFNRGDGTFVERTDFAALAIRGYGETILTADFNNDGYLDLFLPFYSQDSPSEHSYLLINNGDGTFVDIATQLGLHCEINLLSAGWRARRRWTSISTDGLTSTSLAICSSTTAT
jgi:hypothetical protein